MATKNQTTTKSKVLVNTKNRGLKFHWWMALVLAVVVGGVGLLILRFSQAGAPAPNTALPSGEVYWLGDSLSDGLDKNGGLKAKLIAAGYNPATINADPGRSITNPGKIKNQSGLQALDADRAIITKSKSVVIFLGTNPDTNFESAQRELLTKLANINPNLRVAWVDIAAVGNSAWGETIYNYKAGGRVQKADEYNKLIYQNVSKFALSYNVISQFDYIWGDSTQPTSLADKDFPDPQGLMLVDGVHYTNNGYIQLANYLVSAMKTPIFANNNVQSSQYLFNFALTSIPGARISSLNIGTNSKLQSYQVNNLCEQVSKPVKFGNSTGCLIDNTVGKKPIGVQIISDQLKEPANTGKKRICLSVSDRRSIGKIYAQFDGKSYSMSFIGNTLFACTSDYEQINVIRSGLLEIVIDPAGRAVSAAIIRVSTTPY